jgi:hypothetical protein
MSCSIYKINVDYGEFSFSNPLLCINHCDQKLLSILKITSQLDEGDKIIILYLQDILKARNYVIKNKEKLVYDYEQHCIYLLDSMEGKEFEFYYVDGV